MVDVAKEWLSYADLGLRLGISSEAARQRAHRARWPKRVPPGCRAEVDVDADALVASGPSPRRSRGSRDAERSDRDRFLSPLDEPAVIALLSSLREMVGRADAEAEREWARADRERERADGLAAELVRLAGAGSPRGHLGVLSADPVHHS